MDKSLWDISDAMHNNTKPQRLSASIIENNAVMFGSSQSHSIRPIFPHHSRRRLFEKLDKGLLMNQSGILSFIQRTKVAEPQLGEALIYNVHR